MDRIRNPGLLDDPRLFLDESEPLGILATPLDSKWLTLLQEEVCQLIEAAGLELSPDDDTQLLIALNKLVSQHPVPSHQHSVSDLVFSEYGAPGTYALMTLAPWVGVSYGPGLAVNGSILRYASASGESVSEEVVHGTWLCLGYVGATWGGYAAGTTLFYRRY